MNHWVRETGKAQQKFSIPHPSSILISGEKLIPSEKYAMEEVALNEYSLLMNLTIRSLEKRDFGGYICKSSNALGKAEGTVRLRGEFSVILTNVSNRPFVYYHSRGGHPCGVNKHGHNAQVCRHKTAQNHEQRENEEI